MSWCDCHCDEHSLGLFNGFASLESLALGSPTTISYGVSFSGSLKTNGKAVPQADVLKGIYDAMNRFGEIANVDFIRSGSPRFMIRIQSHHIDAAGIQNGNNIYLNTRDPRGWPYSKIFKITAHEGWHWLFGGGHDYRTYLRDGKKCNALMHPYSNPPMWLFAPWEETSLERRFGPVPKPEPEPEPPIPEPEPPVPDPNREELIALRAERVEHKIERDSSYEELDSLRGQRVEINTQIQKELVDVSVANKRLAEINARILELVAVLKS